MSLDFFGPLLTDDITDPVEWCERNITLSKQVSPTRPGPISLAEQPMLREILESALDPTIHHLTECIGTQTLKTTSLQLIFAALVASEPQPMIFSGPTKELTKKLVEQKLLPFIRGNPWLESKLGGRKRLPVGVIPLEDAAVYHVAARNPADVAALAAAFIFVDEAAKVKHAVKTESHPIHLLGERCKSFGSRHLMVMASTPTGEDDPFWQSYLAGDQRKWFVPCPHCGHMQELIFSRETVTFTATGEGAAEDNILSTARYRCISCRGEWDEQQKRAAILRGEWRATSSAPADTRSYHLNSLYSPFVTTADVARKFWQASQAQDGGLALQNFRNSWEALAYVAYARKASRADLLALRTLTYRRGELPDVPLHYIITCYDPGQSCTHWVTTGVGHGGHLYVLDWGTLASFESDTTQPGTVTGPASHFSSQKLGTAARRPDLGYIDSGDWTARIYNECCLLTPGKLIPTKGTTARAGAFGLAPLKTNRAHQLLTYVDYFAKMDLYGRRIGDRLGTVHLPADADEPLLHGLEGQTLLRLPSGKKEWKQLPDDHYGDCLKLAAVSWWVASRKLEPSGVPFS